MQILLVKRMFFLSRRFVTLRDENTAQPKTKFRVCTVAQFS